MKYVFAFLTVLAVASCRPWDKAPATECVDTTAVVADTIAFDTVGVDTLFPND